MENKPSLASHQFGRLTGPGVLMQEDIQNMRNIDLAIVAESIEQYRQQPLLSTSISHKIPAPRRCTLAN